MNCSYVILLCVTNNYILGEYLDNFIIVYLDNIIIYLNSEKEYKEYIK